MDRVLSAAYELFSRRGVHSVGVDEIVARAGVAKATFYRHFKSKDKLIVAFLHRRTDVWTHGWLEKETLSRTQDPKGRLLAIFDVMDPWFRRKDFEGCPFIGVVAHATQPRDRVRAEAMTQLGTIRGFVRRLAEDARARDPEALARSWQALMAGSIVMALAGDGAAAQRAKAVAQVLLEQGGFFS